MTRITLICLVVSTLTLPAAAQPWPRFRGPNGDGISEAATIPVTWTEKDYRWKVALPGIGYSSPVVWGDRVFVTSALEEDGTQLLHCRKTSDGTEIWKREFASITHPKHPQNCYASATPALDAERVYMVWATPEHYFVAALDQARGEEVWRRDLGPFVAEHGYGASPMLYEDLVILVNDQDGTSSAVALEAATGKTRWEIPRQTEKAAYATPCIYQPKGGPAQVILSSWAHGLTGLEPRTGKTIWELGVFQCRVVGSPVVASGMIVASAGGGGVGKRLVAVRPANPAKGVEAEVAYEVTGSLPYVPLAVTNGDLVFLWFDRGVVTCLDGPSGEIHWRERVGGTYFSSPIRVADRIYNTDRDGRVIVLAASKEFKKLAEFELGEPTKSTPAVSDGVMYLRTVSHLMAVGGGAGSGQ